MSTSPTPTNGRIKKLTCTAPCTATPPSYTASTIVSPYAAPNMVATDGSFVYFDSDNGGVNWILKEDVNGITGATLTLAAGTYGYSGDGGPVYAAKVQGLSGIGLNPGGDVYFTQNSDKVLRKIVGPI